MNNTKTMQAEKLRELTTACNEAVLPALEAINAFVESMTKAKTLANNVRWRLNGLSGASIPTKYIDKETKAEGLQYSGINEIFYSAAQAAQYLKIDLGSISAALQNGELYSIEIGKAELIPQKALIIYKIGYL